MLPPYNFYWFRIDNKHMTEPWLDEALMESAYKCDYNMGHPVFSCLFCINQCIERMRCTCNTVGLVEGYHGYTGYTGYTIKLICIYVDHNNRNFINSYSIQHRENSRIRISKDSSYFIMFNQNSA